MIINLTAILNDLLGAAIVVAALVAVAVIIKLLVSAVGKGKPAEDEDTSEPAAAPVYTKSELKLVDVDEKTAALIMAIVSHESGIPLSELEFSSIKLV